MNGPSSFFQASLPYPLDLDGWTFELFLTLNLYERIQEYKSIILNLKRGGGIKKGFLVFLLETKENGIFFVDFRKSGDVEQLSKF